MSNSFPFIKNANQPLIAYDNKLLGDFLMEQFNLDVLVQDESAMINSGVFYGVG